ncbi:hypothetical protein [Motilimonas cestriensis]|uniref:hypothetical protein n=1 Tax=Motilimonas cestriensis TaxID=2742685 RepID=UPI003DA67AF5
MSDSLIIETYPNKLRLLAITMFLLGIYSLLSQGSDLFGVVICVLCGGVLYGSLEKKIAKFNHRDRTLEISTSSVFRHTMSRIKLNDMTKLEVVQGLGNTGGFWFIKVTQGDKSYSITSQGALSKKRLTLELTKISQYLFRNT